MAQHHREAQRRLFEVAEDHEGLFTQSKLRLRIG